MSKEQSVAPKERVNITYKPNNDTSKEVELPLKLLVMGDYTLREDVSLDERKPVSISKDNFNDVMAAHQLRLDLAVPNKLVSESQQRNEEMAVSLKFENIRDFEPDRVAQQVPELKQLLQIREALVSLKGPLGNVAGFRKRLQAIVSDPEAFARLCQELGIEPESQ